MTEEMGGSTVSGLHQIPLNSDTARRMRLFESHVVDLAKAHKLTTHELVDAMCALLGNIITNHSECPQQTLHSVQRVIEFNVKTWQKQERWTRDESRNDK